MNLTEKISYIRGLCDGLELDESKPEVKVLNAIVDLLDDMAFEVSDMEELYDELSAQVDEIDQDLADVESDVYDDEDYDIEDYDDEDDDYFLDDDYEDDDKPAKKGLFKKDSYEDDYDEPEVQKPRFLPRATSNNKVVPMRRGMEVSLIKPTSLEDAREICDYLLAGKAVVLNMEGIHTETAQRIIDFTSGATYSMDGNLQKISNYIFIATPQSVELSGDFQDLLSGGNIDVSGLNIHL